MRGKIGIETVVQDGDRAELRQDRQGCAMKAEMVSQIDDDDVVLAPQMS